MDEPTSYQIHRDALMAAAASSPNASVDVILQTADEFVGWLTDAAQLGTLAEPIIVATADIEDIAPEQHPDSVDVWTGDKHCEACGHLRSVHSGGSCYAVLGKGVCGCNKPKWASV